MKILKFSISSDFGMFKKGNNWQGMNGFKFYTYLFPHIPFILGMIGAAKGFKGYKNIKNKVDSNISIDDCELDYFTELKQYNLYIGIEIHNIPILTNYALCNGIKNGIATKKTDTYIWKNQVIENPKYSFYIYTDDTKKLNDLYENLKNPHYTFKMGKNRFPIHNFDVEIIEAELNINEQIEVSSNILIDSEDVSKNDTFTNISDKIPFSYNLIQHSDFRDCIVSFDKKRSIKVQNKNKFKAFLTDNKMVLLYKVGA